ncbi:MAG: class I SAM-dependent methyltransferase, partial [Candidatus Shapirobacteria bacterium]|nr:class I SAM-dependent methyltransferase [Candidatus Shapirobacteria bacterium]
MSSKEYCPQEDRFSAYFKKEGLTMVRNRGLLCYAKALGIGTTSTPLIRFLNSGAGPMVDLGCGEGLFVKEAAEKVSHRHFVGIDGAGQEENGLNWQITRGHLENLPLESNSINEAVSVMALGYYANNPDQVARQIREVRRCLKKNGRLITVVVPGVPMRPNRLWLDCDDVLSDEARYDRFSLKTSKISLRPIDCFGLENES